MAIMDMLIAGGTAPATGGGSILAGLGGAAVSAFQAHREASINRDFQERMANTAHQREVKDLIAAGLNPILSATGGSGAPTGSGATAAPMQNPVNSALEARQMSAQFDQVKSQTDVNTSSSAFNEAKTRESHASKLNLEQTYTILENQKATSAWQTQTAEQEAKQAALATDAMAANLNKTSNLGDIYQGRTGKILNWVNEISSSIQGSGNSAQTVMNLRNSSKTLKKGK